jgi:hypothetical protein
MIRELGTMALVAALTSGVANNFDMAMGAAQDIVGVYSAARVAHDDPNQFLRMVEAPKARLSATATKIAGMDFQSSVKQGPFGVLVLASN